MHLVWYRSGGAPNPFALVINPQQQKKAYMMRGAKRDKLDPELDHFDVETARELILPLALALDYLHHKV